MVQLVGRSRCACGCRPVILQLCCPALVEGGRVVYCCIHQVNTKLRDGYEFLTVKTVQSSFEWAKRKAIHEARQRTPWAQFYSYAPLAHTDSIRLVEIQAGRATAKLVCTIVHDRLSNYQLSDDTPTTAHQTYEALSYTWGGTAALETIMCSSKSQRDPSTKEQFHTWLYVTANCASALRRLRLKDRPRQVWIDAICIDQSNINERNSQVRMMARIYQTAFQVVVYLGEASDATSRTLTTIITLHKNGSLTAPQLLQPHRIEAIQHLLSQAWFSRIWVLQEVYMARSAVALFGSEPLDWELLIGMAKEAKALLWDLIQIQLPYALVIQDDDLCAKNLFDLLCGTRHCASTDPRDKYFALLSMVEGSDRENLAADYSKDVAGIFTKLAIFLLEHIGLDFLTAVEGSVGSGFLPSWVPDWSISEGLGYLPRFKETKKRAGGPCNRSMFKLEEMLRGEPDPGEKLANYLLERDDLESGIFTSPRDGLGDWTLLPPSERGCRISSNWQMQTNDICSKSGLVEGYEDRLEHKGDASNWSNFKTKTDIHLRPVPEDWSIVVHRYCTNATRLQCSQSSHEDPFQMPVLTVRGLSIDKIDFLTSKCDLSRDDWLSITADWHKIIFNWLRDRPSAEAANDIKILEPATEYRNVTESFYRTISWDALPSYEPLFSETTNDGNVFPPAPTDIQSDLPCFKAAVKLAINNRRLFMTASGKIGLCSADSQIGDEVCVFLGAVYPCVLRKITYGSGYAMVGGTCYLQGVMDREAFRGDPQLEEFVIW